MPALPPSVGHAPCSYAVMTYFKQELSSVAGLSLLLGWIARNDQRALRLKSGTQFWKPRMS